MSIRFRRHAQSSAKGEVMLMNTHVHYQLGETIVLVRAIPRSQARRLAEMIEARRAFEPAQPAGPSWRDDPDALPIRCEAEGVEMVDVRQIDADDPACVLYVKCKVTEAIHFLSYDDEESALMELSEARKVECVPVSLFADGVFGWIYCGETPGGTVAATPTKASDVPAKPAAKPAVQVGILIGGDDLAPQ